MSHNIKARYISSTGATIVSIYVNLYIISHAPSPFSIACQIKSPPPVQGSHCWCKNHKLFAVILCKMDMVSELNDILCNTDLSVDHSTMPVTTKVIDLCDFLSLTSSLTAEMFWSLIIEFWYFLSRTLSLTATMEEGGGRWENMHELP
jgi:hypothetical protein